MAKRKLQTPTKPRATPQPTPTPVPEPEERDDVILGAGASGNADKIKAALKAREMPKGDGKKPVTLPPTPTPPVGGTTSQLTGDTEEGLLDLIKQALERLYPEEIGTPGYNQRVKAALEAARGYSRGYVLKALASPESARTFADSALAAAAKEPTPPSVQEQVLTRIESRRGFEDDAHLDEFRKLVSQRFANITGPEQEEVYTDLVRSNGFVSLWDQAASTVEGERQEKRAQAFNAAYKTNVLLPLQTALGMFGPNTRPEVAALIKRVEGARDGFGAGYENWYLAQVNLAPDRRDRLDTVGPTAFLMENWLDVAEVISPSGRRGGLVRTAEEFSTVVKEVVGSEHDRVLIRADRQAKVKAELDRYKDALVQRGEAIGGLDDTARLELKNAANAIGRLTAGLVSRYQDLADTVDPAAYVAAQLPGLLQTELIASGSSFGQEIIAGTASGSVNALLGLAVQGSQARVLAAAEAKAQADQATRVAGLRQLAIGDNLDPNAVEAYAKDFPNLSVGQIVADFKARGQPAKDLAAKLQNIRDAHQANPTFDLNRALAIQTATPTLTTQQAINQVGTEKQIADLRVAAANPNAAVAAQARAALGALGVPGFGVGAAPPAGPTGAPGLVGVPPATGPGGTRAPTAAEAVIAAGEANVAAGMRAREGAGAGDETATPERRALNAEIEAAFRNLKMAHPDWSDDAIWAQVRPAFRDRVLNLTFGQRFSANVDLAVAARKLTVADPNLSAAAAIKQAQDEATQQRVTAAMGSEFVVQGNRRGPTGPGAPGGFQPGTPAGSTVAEQFPGADARLRALLAPGVGGAHQAVTAAQLLQALGGGQSSVELANIMADITTGDRDLVGGAPHPGFNTPEDVANAVQRAAQRRAAQAALKEVSSPRPRSGS